MYKKLLYAFIGVALLSCHQLEQKAENEVSAISTPSSSETAKAKLENNAPIPVGDVQQQAPLDSATQQDDQAPHQQQQQRPPKPQPAPIPTTDWSKKLIKTANMRLEVEDFKKYGIQLQSSIQQYAAYIADEESNYNDGNMENTVTIKVPVQNFEGLVGSLPGDKSKVLSRTIKSQDVTGDIVDTKSRLEAKKVMRLKYLDFLKQSKNMEEVLQVQNEINSIQEEIEAASGRVALLSNQSAYSTINLTYYQAGTSISNNGSFMGEVGSAFKTGLSVLSGIFIVFIKIWPLLLIAFIGYFLYKRNKRLTPENKRA